MWRNTNSLKRLWCWESLRAGGERNGRGWLLTWTGFWANSGRSGGQGSLACCSPWDNKNNKDERLEQEEEMVGWHHWLNGHEFEQALGVGDRQGTLVCCSPWGHKEADTTEQLNWTEFENKNGLSLTMVAKTLGSIHFKWMHLLYVNYILIMLV